MQMQLKWLASAGAALLLMVATAASAGAWVSMQANDGWGSNGVPRYQHIFEIVMENHSYDEVIGQYTPQITALAQQYGLATNYYGVTHPSEPNYVALIGGSFFGIQDDANYDTITPDGVNHTIDAPSLATQLESAGLTWKTYQQGLPEVGSKVYDNGNGLYKSKHNPFLNFADIQNNPSELQNMVPDTQLATDLQSGNMPSFSFIVPDQCHDMHGDAAGGCDSGDIPFDANDVALLQAGDSYVGATVNAIMASKVWQQGNNAIVVTWDEDDFADTNLGCCDANPGGGHVATIVITNHGVRGITDNTAYNHYSLLRTVEQAFGLGCLENACDSANVQPMTSLFRNGRGH